MLRSFSSRPLYQRSLRRLIYLYRRSVWLSLRQRVSVFIFILVAVQMKLVDATHVYALKMHG